ncbi:MaoC family dehydratase N-terminal domain-containing protein [Brevundimonas sp.]|jgi:acyl dehydratase|uniref:MaoC family dehydratase N-terminal domain-containing protein n=1 Tax=Brevundimonas sp. TaxID=1871086 RepID=UPI0037842587
MIDHSHIGAETEEVSIVVERSQLRLFCQATGETDPVFWDAGAARAAGHDRIPTPPTYPQTLLNLSPFAKNLVLDVIKVDLARMLHGEQTFEHHHPIFVGDTIRLKQTVADIYDKKGGALEFIVLETTARNQDDVVCCTLKSVAVVRN